MNTTNVWIKYLPVLRIILKRALTGEQKFALNSPDFVKAGYNRKSGYKFFVKLSNGRLHNVVTDMPLASLLVSALLSDEAIKDFLSNEEFQITMSAKYELTIKHIPQLQPAE